MTKISSKGSRFLRGIIVSGRVLMLASLVAYAALGCGNVVSTKGNQSTTGGTRNVTCTAGTSTGEVQAPQYKMTLPGETSWFASPIIRDLDGDGQKELIAAYYSVFVYDSQGKVLGKAEGGDGRVYAPHIVADLDKDGIVEIVYGSDHEVWAYEWKNKALSVKAGWPVSTTTGNNPPEVRGMAAGDIDGDGQLEVVVTTT